MASVVVASAVAVAPEPAQAEAEDMRVPDNQGQGPVEGLALGTLVLAQKLGS